MNSKPNAGNAQALVGMAKNNGNAASVPKVPGAFFARPVPKPNAKKCAGCESRNLESGKVVITFGLKLNQFIFRIIHAQA